MAELKDSTADSLALGRAAAAPDEAVRLGEMTTALALKANASDVTTALAGAVHNPVTTPANLSLTLAVSGGQALTGEVRLPAEVESQPATGGLAAAFLHPIIAGSELNLGYEKVLNVVVNKRDPSDVPNGFGVEDTDYVVNYPAGTITILAGSVLITTTGEDVYATFDASQILTGSALEITSDGLQVKLGGGRNEAAAGDHVHANDHRPVTPGASETIALTISPLQVVTAEVKIGAGLETDGSTLKVNLAVVAAASHTHPAVTGSVAGFMTPAMLAAIEAAEALEVISVADTNTITLFKDVNGQLTADIREGVGIHSEVGGITVDFDVVATKTHTHKVPTGISEVTVTAGGTGYTAATAAVVGDGEGATVSVTVAGGAVTAIIVVDPGAGYTAATINISGTGAGATASATVFNAPGFVHPAQVGLLYSQEDTLFDYGVVLDRLVGTIDNNLIPAGSSFDGSGHFIVGTTLGRSYTWNKDASETSLVNGSETLTAIGTFIAVGASVTINGPASTPVFSTVFDVTPEAKADTAILRAELSAPLLANTDTVNWTWGDLSKEGTTVYDPTLTYAYGNKVFNGSTSLYYVALRAVSPGVSPPNTSYWAELEDVIGAADWVDQDYIAGNQVHYTPTNKDYQCHTPTTTHQIPTNTAFWGEIPAISLSFADVSLKSSGGISSDVNGLMLDYSNDTPTSEVVNDPGDAGISDLAAREDHVHPMPGLATTSAHGFMSKEDKALIEGFSPIGTALVGFDAPVRSLLVDNDKVYVGGDFTKYGSTSSSKIAKLGLQGVQDVGFGIGTGFTQSIQFLVKSTDGFVLAGTTSSVNTYNGTLGGLVWKLQTNGDVGTFTCPNPIATVGGETLVGIAAINNRIALLTPRTFRVVNNAGASQFSKEGTTEFKHVAGLIGTINFLVSSRAYSSAGVGQTYDSITDPKGLKLIDSTGFGLEGTFATGAGTGAETTCGRIAVDPVGDFCIVGNNANHPTVENGADTSWNSIGGANADSFRGLLKVLADGTSDEAHFDVNIEINTGEGPVIPFICNLNGKIYFGGPVTSVNGNVVTPWRLYRLNADGTFDVEFDDFNGKVLCAARIDDNNIVVGGEFTEYGSRLAGRVIFLNADGEPVGVLDNPLGVEEGVVISSTIAPDVIADPKQKRNLWKKPAVSAIAANKIAVWNELGGGWMNIN